MHLTPGCWAEDIVGRTMATFTALNGGEQKGPEIPSGSPTSIPGVSEEERPARQGVPKEPRAEENSSSQRERWPASGTDRPPYQPNAYPSTDGLHKRKRSLSHDSQGDGPGTRDQEQQSQSESRDVYVTAQREHRQLGEESREHHESWYTPQGRIDDRNAYDHQSSTGFVTSPTDQPAGDSLRRAAPHPTESQHDYSVTSPDGEDGAVIYSGTYTTGPRKGDAVIQSDPKKRKRNFSNRTKTGMAGPVARFLRCHKCASALKDPRRKKKCDETKPQCTNCVRGGFVCHGYPNQRGYPKMENKPAAVPLESKDPTATSSTMQLPTPLSGVERHKDYQRVPPLHDLTRTEHETPHTTSLPQINILPPTRTNSPPAQPSNQHPPPPPPATTSPQEAARLALSHSHFPAKISRTQKEEMLSGNQYYPFDEELVMERQRCNAACWRFNNSTNPNFGVSTVERSRLFREILSPQEPLNIAPHLVTPVTKVGSVGQDVVVEAPFTCDYGYNIMIGSNTFIGRNCTVIDPMEIIIGNNCYIGPNVSLFGATLHTDPKKRKGSKSPHHGASIHVDDDVWIGGGAIILPGMRIGKGATVAAGSVVTKLRMSLPLPSWPATPPE
ncbi:trimeric LpxA-like protein [Durotheca rogersii]|uniref:trimeric LpxA-like protein n=1 Tax=Durotheca rogersii TaxID=419775 RepID=UPI00221FC763|nr:trimeric LpxA-like protein [Durotheca rogersii]KAI5855054.1 trimeric LpxA-like protein [Durotheca rogersii]